MLLTQKLPVSPAMREICAEFHHLPTMPCVRCFSPSVQDKRPSGTIYIAASISSYLWSADSTDFNLLYRKIWRKCSSRSTKFVTSENTEAALDRCLTCVWAKCHQWSSLWVAQTSLCVYSCERRKFWAFNLTPYNAYVVGISYLLILWTFSKSNCVTCSTILPILVFCVSLGTNTFKVWWKTWHGFCYKFHWEYDGEKIENRSTFVKVMNECRWHRFLTHFVYVYICMRLCMFLELLFACTLCTIYIYI